jgi:hypothetical protein
MKKLTIEIDAGEATCDGCLFCYDSGRAEVCGLFAELLVEGNASVWRCPECLAAEQREENK